MYNFAEVPGLAGAAERDRLQALGDRLQFDDPINIQFTSGTTGFPKGATLSHHNILNNGYFNGVTLGLSERDRVCIPVPLYHCFGMVMGQPDVGRVRRDHGLPERCLRPAGGSARGRGGALHGALRRAHHVHRRARPSGVRALRSLLAPHRHDGGLALPHRGHAPRDRRDAHGRGDHRLRHDRDQPGELPVGDRRPHRAPGLHRRPRAPPCRGQGREPGRQGGAQRRDRRTADARLLGHARILERRGKDPRVHRWRGLDAHRRPGHHRRRRLLQHRRPHQGHGDPRRRETSIRARSRSFSTATPRCRTCR